MSNVENLIVKYNVSDAEITKIAEETKGLSADTAEGYKMVVKGIRCTRELRSKVESCRVTLKADALAYGRKVDEEAGRIKSCLLEIETPLKLLKKGVDDEKARIKLEAENKKREEERLKMEARLEEERKARKAQEKIEREKREAKERVEREARIAKEKEEREAHEKRIADQRKRLEEEREAEKKRVDEWRKKQEEERKASDKRLAEQEAYIEGERKRLEDERIKQREIDEQSRKKAKTVADQLMEERRALEKERQLIEEQERKKIEAKEQEKLRALEVEKQRQKVKDDKEACKEYLGDGVYISLSASGVVLQVSDGINATDTIYLERDVIMALKVYVNRHVGGIQLNLNPEKKS